MMTNEQVDEIENKLRQAQNLVEECGAAICGERGEKAASLWDIMTSAANVIGDIIHELYVIRPEALNDDHRK